MEFFLGLLATVLTLFIGFRELQHSAEKNELLQSANILRIDNGRLNEERNKLLREANELRKLNTEHVAQISDTLAKDPEKQKIEELRNRVGQRVLVTRASQRGHYQPYDRIVKEVFQVGVSNEWTLVLLNLEAQKNWSPGQKDPSDHYPTKDVSVGTIAHHGLTWMLITLDKE